MYKNYLRLLAKWPRDPRKAPGRSLPLFMEKEVESSFKKGGEGGNSRSPDAILCQRRFDALSQLLNNTHLNDFPHSYKSGIFGLQVKQLEEINSDKFRKLIGLGDKKSYSLLSVGRNTYCQGTIKSSKTTTTRLLSTMPPVPFVAPAYTAQLNETAHLICEKDVVLVVPESCRGGVFEELKGQVESAIQAANGTDYSFVTKNISNMGMVKIAHAYHYTGSEPLIFIRGNCIGHPTQFEAFVKQGLLEKALSKKDYDLIVIGGGSAGLSGAKLAAGIGKKVLVLDFVKPTPIGTTWGLGGTCVNVGCIPKKLMHQASLLGHSLSDAKKFGWDVCTENVTLNWVKMKDAVNDHIAALNWGYKVALREKKATYLNAYGSVTAPFEVTTTDKKGKKTVVSADKILVATGLRPKYPSVPGAKEYAITSDDLFSLPYNPGKTLSVGASYISLECSGFIKGMGNESHVMVRSILLRGFDQDMAERIKKQMAEEGIKFISAVPTKIEQIKAPTEKEAGLYKVWGEGVDGEGKKVEYVDEYNTVLFAIGREAKTEDIGIKEHGVKLSEAGKVIGFNGGEQSVSMPYIYACGDVLHNCPELTPVAIQAATTLMKKLFLGALEVTDYDNIPTTVFTPLEYGCCGLSTEQAQAKYGKENITEYHNVFTPLEYTVPDRKESKHCYLKLICLNTEHDRVLGLHILSPNAGEITQGFGIALKLNATKRDFDNLVGIHPSVAENFTTLNIVKKEGDEELVATGC
uniref:Thioredoxin reductase 1, cytoplasmic n=1 Tax=Rhabditophanes sp. KR3021 TaxID=114890 RepID=A0AC35U1N5_9BILA